MLTGTLTLQRSEDRATYRNGCIVLALLAVALVTRAGRIGDPAIHMDEQFYLLVADRMWHGALPYVDIWDRKPILLFLIYAALRPFSPDGIVAYQIGALLFATATAFVIVVIAQRFANPSGALLAGITYLLYLPILGGGAGGQAPVFYNLFMAIGALEVIRAGEAHEATGIWRHGLRCMLWTGLAIQVKYTAALEGVAFGLWLTALLVRRNGGADLRVLVRVGLWALTALAPTLLAASFYILAGHGQAFLEANFLSIFAVREPDGFSFESFLVSTAQKLIPLLLFAAFSSQKLARSEPGAPRTFLALWTAFAIAGFFAIGNYYDHYALPLLVPVTIVCAPLLGTKNSKAVGIVLFGWFGVLVATFPWEVSRQRDEYRIAAMVDAARPYAARGCIYLNDGPTIVYLLTHSCLPTRYVFPEHLNNAAEARATDAARNMVDLLATRPSAIFLADRPLEHPRNLVTAAMVDAAIANDYQRVATFPDVLHERRQFLYVRNDLLPQQATYR
jgi:hypothetical protein